MVLAGTDRLTHDAQMFWRSHLPAGVSPELQEWLGDRVVETQLLWQNVGWLDRSRRMLRELTEQLEARDPTNPWTRQYERIYFESQLMTLTRTVNASRRRQPRRASLTLLLREFIERPELLGALSGVWAPEELQEPADPSADLAELRRVMRPLVPWRDRAVAHLEVDHHLEGGRRLAEVAWTDLDDAIDTVFDVFHRYSLRLTGVDYQIDHEGPPWTDWQKVFAQPLFTDQTVIPPESGGGAT
ncbi:MAG TPA: hypothetical protein VN886_17945 [Acidimicrobiales bacterium]|nr:hypothetical protein [Acidimicrobiales bacterium]